MKMLKKICRIMGGVLMAVVVILYAVMTVPGLLGYESYSIVSGSMEPEIPVGSLVFAHREDPALLAAGDVAVFYANGSPVTHRVCENHLNERELVTKGDANESVDPGKIPYFDVVGRMTLCVPHMGSVSLVMASTQGKLGAASGLLAALLLVLLGREEEEKEGRSR